MIFLQNPHSAPDSTAFLGFLTPFAVPGDMLAIRFRRRCISAYRHPFRRGNDRPSRPIRGHGGPQRTRVPEERVQWSRARAGYRSAAPWRRFRSPSRRLPVALRQDRIGAVHQCPRCRSKRAPDERGRSKLRRRQSGAKRLSRCDRMALALGANAGRMRSSRRARRTTAPAAAVSSRCGRSLCRPIRRGGLVEGPSVAEPNAFMVGR